jgi:uncharacterized protein
MTPLSFPDVNVWFALAAPEHEFAAFAKRWWNAYPGSIAFCRMSQLALLRLLTTAATMDGKPLSNLEALAVHDRFFHDDRVIFVSEPREAEAQFRIHAALPSASPKVWADVWLLACAQTAGGTLVTFDRALASRSSQCLLLGKGVAE